MREQADRDVILAWHVVYIWVKTQNDKYMPSLKQLLQRGKASPSTTREQQLALFQQMALQYRGVRIRVKT